MVVEHKKKNDPKIFYSSAKLIASDSDIDKAFKFMYQSIMTKTKNSAGRDWIVETILKHSINPIQDGRQKGPPTSFNFYKRRN